MNSRVSFLPRRLLALRSVQLAENAALLAGVVLVIVLAMAPHFTRLPVWIPLWVIIAAGWRLYLEYAGRPLPPRWLRTVLAIAGMGAIIASFRSLNGVDAGTALLALMAGMKLLETRARRDLTVLIFLCYFLIFSALLYDQSLLLLPYIVVVIWLLTTALLRLHASYAAVSYTRAATLTGRMLLQALPFAVLLFLLMPRLPGQFWALPSRSEATTGLSDEMSPGDVTRLSLSDALAFRVHFEGRTPPAEQRYWRAIVMNDFDGRTWHARRDFPMPLQAGRIAASGETYRYRLALEPTQQRWIPALDIPVTWPGGWPLPRTVMTSDMVLMSPQPVSTLLTLQLESSPQYIADAELPKFLRQMTTRLPQGRNPRALAMAEQWRTEAGNDAAYIQRVLRMFSEQQFSYTLEPDPLGLQAIDDFLFNTRNGFCEHYASAFTVLMRAVGIPARVVTGYQGGEFNGLGDYYILRQADAHAWSEVWLEGRGWTRVDPTAAIAPQRIELGMDAALGANEPVPGRMLRRFSMINQMRLTWDAVNAFWNDRIVDFSIDEQRDLFRWFGIDDPKLRDFGLSLLIAFIAFGAALAAWLAWRFRRPAPDPAAAAYAVLKRKLARRQLVCAPHEGPLDFLNRAAATHPQQALLDECRELYIALRYGPHPNADLLSRLRYLIDRID